MSVVATGFRIGGTTELWGRLPGALLALLALGSLMAAARNLGDRRLAAYTGIAYATLPLVFMNARQMFGGGLAQSATTLGALGPRARPLGPRARAGASPARWSACWASRSAEGAAGVMLGVVPVLGAAGIAVALRFARETRQSRAIGAVAFVLAGGLAIKCLMVASRELTGYSPWVGASNLSQPAGQWQTFEVYLENLAHASFPWTGLVPFGLVRLVSPPSPIRDRGRALLDDDELDALDPWRESGLRLMAFVAIALGFALQTFHMQIYGMTPSWWWRPSPSGSRCSCATPSARSSPGARWPSPRRCSPRSCSVTSCSSRRRRTRRSD